MIGHNNTVTSWIERLVFRIFLKTPVRKNAKKDCEGVQEVRSKHTKKRLFRFPLQQQKFTRNFSLLIVILVACKEMLCIIAISRTTVWENCGRFYASIISSSRWLGRASETAFIWMFMPFTYTVNKRNHMRIIKTGLNNTVSQTHI